MQPSAQYLVSPLKWLLMTGILKAILLTIQHLTLQWAPCREDNYMAESSKAQSACQSLCLAGRISTSQSHLEPMPTFLAWGLTHSMSQKSVLPEKKKCNQGMLNTHDFASQTTSFSLSPPAALIWATATSSPSTMETRSCPTSWGSTLGTVAPRSCTRPRQT